MTTRELFERVTDHLLTQGERSVDPGTGSCAYRGRNGTACAVGCLISDSDYDHAMEGRTVRSLDVTGGSWSAASSDSEVSRRESLLARALNESGTPATDETQRVLCELQRVHDSFEPADWPRQLVTIGRGVR